MGIQFAEQYGGAGDVGRRLLHLHRGARARLSRRSRCRSPRTTASAPRTSRCSATTRRSSRYLPRLIGGEVLGAWGLTEANAGSDAASMRTSGDARRGTAGSSTASKTFITHGKIGGVHGRDGGHRSREGRTAASRRSSSSTARRACRPGKKENKLGMRASDTSEVIFQDCRVPADRAARRGGAGVHQHPAGARRRPHRHRGAVGRPRAGRLRGGAQVRARSAGSSASRSPRSRRSSGSWPTTPRASRRRGC